MIGAATAMADSGGRMAWLPCVLCFLFAFVMQVDAIL
jgi:1,4-dihydroxy-2-naphthoate octaprenyltransferase